MSKKELELRNKLRDIIVDYSDPALTYSEADLLCEYFITQIIQKKED